MVGVAFTSAAQFGSAPGGGPVPAGEQAQRLVAEQDR